MWDAITAWGGWDEVGASGAWLVTVCLVAIGLIGCLVPVLPGHLFILLAAVSHRLLLGSGSGIDWWTFAVLAALMAASQAFEFASGAAGAKWFGGSRWGSAGALLGGIAGMFFMPFGLLAGPLLGALVFELAFARKELHPATVSGVGSVVGVAAGMVVKLVIGALMAAWLFADIWWIG
jgi:hypothetical protein